MPALRFLSTHSLKSQVRNRTLVRNGRIAASHVLLFLRRQELS